MKFNLQECIFGSLKRAKRSCINKYPSYFFEKQLEKHFGNASPAIRFISLRSLPASIRFRWRSLFYYLGLQGAEPVLGAQGLLFLNPVVTKILFIA